MHIGVDHTCNMDRVGIVLIKMFDGMVIKLKDMRYVPQIKNFILFGALKAHGLEFTGKDGVLKVLKNFVVVLKCVRCNNLYYLKDNTVTRKMTISVGTDDDLTRL